VSNNLKQDSAVILMDCFIKSILMQQMWPPTNRIYL